VKISPVFSACPLHKKLVWPVVTAQKPTRLFETLLSRASYNDRNAGKVVVFRDSRSRICKSNIVTVAHNVIQKWNFSWFDLTEEIFKSKIKELTKTQQNPFNN